MTNTRKSVICALCIALCTVLPMAFHAIPNASSIYLPMHIPVLLCGLIAGWPFGLFCGIAGPVISSLLTGMPGAGYLPQMAIELAVYGFAIGLVFKLVRTRNTIADIYIALVIALLSGRIIAGILRALIFARGGYTVSAWVTSYFVTGLPGIIIQLIVIPALYIVLERSNLIARRNVQ